VPALARLLQTYCNAGHEMNAEKPQPEILRELLRCRDDNLMFSLTASLLGAA